MEKENDKKELIKSNALLISNIVQDLNDKQILILTYSLLNLTIEDGVPKSQFRRADFLKACRLGKDNYKKKDIATDLDILEAIQIREFDDDFFLSSDLLKGKYSVKSPIYKCTYEKGLFSIEWASNPDNVEMLQGVSEEVSKYDFNLLISLSNKGWTLYEVIVALDQRGIKSMTLSTAEVARYFKAVGKKASDSNYLKTQYLDKAIAEINKEKNKTYVEYEDIKEGKKIVSFDIKWGAKLEEGNPISDKQKNFAQDLILFFNQNNDKYLDDKEYQSIKKSISMPEKYNSNQYYLLLKKANNLKTQITKKINIIDNDNLIIQEIEPYEMVLNKWEGKKIKLGEKNRLTGLLVKYPENEREEILELSMKIAEDRKMTNFKYCLTTIEEWIDNDIHTAVEANNFFNAQYGGFEKINQEIEIGEDFKYILENPIW